MVTALVVPSVVLSKPALPTRFDPAGSGEFGENDVTNAGSPATAGVDAAFTATGPFVVSPISVHHACAFEPLLPCTTVGELLTLKPVLSMENPLGPLAMSASPRLLIC